MKLEMETPDFEHGRVYYRQFGAERDIHQWQSYICEGSLKYSLIAFISKKKRVLLFMLYTSLNHVHARGVALQ